MVTAKKKEEVKEEPVKTEKYFYGLGRRKAAIAQVRIYSQEKANEGDRIVNDRKMSDYFPTLKLQSIFMSPLKTVSLDDKFRVTVYVKGGGIDGQVGAIRLGLSRALIKFDEALKTVLKKQGFLTRDSRVVERKKPGLRKARRAPQWAKR